MELRRVSRQRGITVKDGGQFFVIYLDQAERFQGRVFIDSSDGRDLVSNVPDLIYTEQLLIPRVSEHAPFFPCCILPRYHRVDAPKLPGLRGVNVKYSGVGIGCEVSSLRASWEGSSPL